MPEAKGKYLKPKGIKALGRRRLRKDRRDPQPWGPWPAEEGRGKEAGSSSRRLSSSSK